MRCFAIAAILVAGSGLNVTAQQPKPTADPQKWSLSGGYCPNFIPPEGFVYRNELATFVIDGPKRIGVADYLFTDGKCYRDKLVFDPSRSRISTSTEPYAWDRGFLYRVPNEPFWLFFSDYASFKSDKYQERYRVFYSQNGTNFFIYATPKGTIRIPLPTASPDRSAELAAVLPAKFEFDMGGFIRTSYKISLEGESIRYIRTPASSMVLDDVKLVTPTAEQWKTFWKKVDKLQVWQWRGDYKTPNTSDGTQWQLNMQFKDKSIVTKGDNGYPKDGDVGVRGVLEQSETFQAYVDAVKELLGVVEFPS